MRAVAVCAAACVIAGAAAGPAAALDVFAHRGGPVVDGRAAYPENTLPAFRAAARAGTALELDVRRTLDGVPLVIHDATFARTTTCAGAVSAHDSGSVRRRCRADVLGIAGDRTAPSRPSTRTNPVPTLQQVLAIAERFGVPAMVEVKSAADAFAVTDAIRDAGFPRAQVIIQSFSAYRLDIARRRWPGVPTALLSSNADRRSARDHAAGRFTWIAPRWPIDEAYVKRAHELGLRVMPFAVDSLDAVLGSADAGADAFITDDPSAARRLLVAGGQHN